MGNPSDLAVEPSGAAQEAWGAQPAPATRWHCLPGPRGGWGLRMTFPLRLPDLVFPSDWCEGPRPTPQLAAGRAWLCGLKQVPLPLWASARGCLLSSQWHVPPGSGWGGLWANCGPVSLKCNSLSSRLPSGWGRLLDLHLLSPAPVHLSPSQRPSQKGPPCPPQTKQWPGDGLAATRFSVSAEPSALRTHCPPRPQHTAVFTAASPGFLSLIY